MKEYIDCRNRGIISQLNYGLKNILNLECKEDDGHSEYGVIKRERCNLFDVYKSTSVDIYKLEPLSFNEAWKQANELNENEADRELKYYECDHATYYVVRI